jgi:hypothetical protein
MSLRGKGSKEVFIITAYRVCKTTFDSAGDTTSYMQQYRSILNYWNEIGKQETPNPHKQFVLDLQAWISHLRSDGKSIILCLDANETVTPDDGMFHPLDYHNGTFIQAKAHDGSLATLAKTCGLVDILSHQHSFSVPSTYARGKNRLDYIYISDDISQSALCSGILPLYSIFLGDHNACYVDLDAEILFGDDTHPLAPASRRGLQLLDPRKVISYKEHLHKQLEYHKVFDKLKDLTYAAEHNLWSEQHTKEYNALDRIITESMIYAEKEITRVITGNYEWSVQLAQAIHSLRYWKLRIKRAHAIRVTDYFLTATHQLAGLPQDATDQMTLPALIQNLHQSKEYLASCKKNHVALRESYLQGLAEAIVLQRCPFLDEPRNSHLKAERVAKELQELIKREQIRRMHRKIGAILRDETDNHGCLSRVDIPSSSTDPYPEGPDPKQWSGSWSSVTAPEEIARHICAANSRQYHQAHNTPFAQDPLLSHIGASAQSPGANDILAGYLPDEDILDLLQPETINMLRTLTETSPINNTSRNTSIITEDDFISCYKVVKERTSSSPSGRHVGHYKAAATCPLLSQLHSTMMSLPFQVGFSPDRWHRVVDVMLEKQPGCPKIHRLRILALLESDFNHATRILFARQLGFKLEDSGQVPTMQYGSRPGRQCVSAVLNKQLTHDIVRHQKSTAAFIENDAVGCYDRMVNNLVLLELRRMGMPATAVEALGATWANATHQIKTRYGLSDTTYSNSSEHPLYGPGQGSTIGPFIWLILFTLIVKSIDPQTPRTTFTSVTGDMTISDIGEGFVDDVEAGCTANHKYDPSMCPNKNKSLSEEEAKRKLIILAQEWERLLFATGGAICFQKSFWFLISWVWTKSGTAKLASIKASPGDLCLTEGFSTNTPIRVPRIETNSSYRTLGVQISPSGGTDAAYSHLKSQSVTFAGRISNSTLTRGMCTGHSGNTFTPRSPFQFRF